MISPSLSTDIPIKYAAESVIPKFDLADLELAQDPQERTKHLFTDVYAMLTGLILVNDHVARRNSAFTPNR